MAKFEHIAEQESVKEFVAEVNAQCWRYGYKTQESFGNAIGVSQVTAGAYLRDPRNMAFSTLRRLVKAVKPDPVLLLKAVGYTVNDIKKIMKEFEA